MEFMLRSRHPLSISAKLSNNLSLVFCSRESVASEFNLTLSCNRFQRRLHARVASRLSDGCVANASHTSLGACKTLESESYFEAHTRDNSQLSLRMIGDLDIGSGLSNRIGKHFHVRKTFIFNKSACCDNLPTTFPCLPACLKN